MQPSVAEKYVEEEIPEITQEFIDSAPPLVKEVIEYQRTIDNTKPAFLISSALFALSFSKGRNHFIQVLLKKPPIFANCYYLNIGKTGVGKDASMKFLEDILTTVYCQDVNAKKKLLSTSLTHGIASASGLRHALQDSAHVALMWDEFGKEMVKKRLGSNEQEIKALFLELYSKVNKRLLPKRYSKRPQFGFEEKIIPFPFFTMMGSTTPDMFSEMADTTAFTDGLLSRFTFFHSASNVGEELEFAFDDSLLSNPGDGTVSDVSYRVLTAFEKGLEYYFNDPSGDSFGEPTRRRIEVSLDAKKFLQESWRAQEEHRKNATSAMIAGLHSRFFEKTLSTCVAIADWDKKKDNFVLDLASAEWAVEIQRRSFKTMKGFLTSADSGFFGVDTRNENDIEKGILRYLSNQGTVTKAKLARGVGFTRSTAKGFNKSLNALVQSGVVEEVRVSKTKLNYRIC